MRIGIIPDQTPWGFFLMSEAHNAQTLNIERWPVDPHLTRENLPVCVRHGPREEILPGCFNDALVVPNWLIKIEAQFI
jgi:hypothetical protein